MWVLRRCLISLLAGLVLACVATATVAEQRAVAAAAEIAAAEQGFADYLQQNYDEAVPLLEQAYWQNRQHSVLRFLLADSYYRHGDYHQALPLLQEFVATYDALPVGFLITEALLAIGDAEQALSHSEYLLRQLQRRSLLTALSPFQVFAGVLSTDDRTETGSEQANDEQTALVLEELSAIDLTAIFLADEDISSARARYLRARARLALGDTTAAITDLEQALVEAEGTLAQDIGVELLPLYIELDRLQDAKKLAAQAAGPAPSSFGSNVLNALTQSAGLSEPLQLTAGYRLQIDSEPGADPSPVLLQQRRFTDADLSHSVFAELDGRYALADGLELFVDGYASQSVHQAGSSLNHTELRVSAGLGWSWPNYGLRLPLELGHQRLSGERLQSTLALLPSVYYRFGANHVLYGYGRFQLSEVDEEVVAADDRSSSKIDFGALYIARLVGGRLRLRTALELGSNNAEGRNWEHERWRLALYGDYQIDDRFSAGVGFEYLDFDYDHPHSDLGEPRRDTRRAVSLSTTYQLDSRWRLELQAVHQDANSNLDFYRYDRNLISFSVSRRF